MATEIVYIDNFRFGQNDTKSPLHLKDGECLLVENADLLIDGGVSSRNGVLKVNETSFGGKIRFAKEWHIGSVKRDILVVETIVETLPVYTIGYYDAVTDTWYPKLELASFDIGYFFWRHQFYFSDGDDYYIWGGYDFMGGQQDAVDVYIGDVVYDIDGKFYQAVIDQLAVLLPTEDFTDALKWLDVTDVTNFTSDTIKPVNPYLDDNLENYLEPIMKCTMFAFHPKSFRFFASGNPDNPTALYFSEYGNPAYFKGTNVLYPVSSQGEIKGIDILIDSVLISYNTCWYAWSGIDIDTDTNWRALPIPYGVSGKNAKCVTPYSLTFFDGERIVVISADILSQEISTMQNANVLDPITDETVMASLVNAKNIKNANMVFHNGKVHLAYCDDALLDYNNVVMEFTFNLRAGYNFIRGWKVHDFLIKSNGDMILASNNYMLLTNQGNSITGEGFADIDTETGEPVPISTTIKTRPIDCGYADKKKYLKRIYLIARQYRDYVDDSQINIYIEGEYKRYKVEGLNLTESLTWGRSWGKLWGFSDTIYKFAEVDIQGINFTIKLDHNQIDDKFTIYAIGLEFEVIKTSMPVRVDANEQRLLR